MDIAPFHLSVPVDDLEATRRFYHQVLDCPIGRETDRWIDFNFFGHQLSVHLKPGIAPVAETSEVDGKKVPVRHFGAILEWEAFHTLADRLKGEGMPFVIAPYIRFEGLVGEQATMFFLDPSGNALEFKSFKDKGQIFAA